MRDWREDYTICQHIADNKELKARHQQFRVCCEECYLKDFLWIDHEKMEYKTIGVLTVATPKNE